MMRPRPDARAGTEARLLAIFREDLELEVETETALIDEGLLDSVAFVRLLTELEQAFGVRVDIAELDLDDFASVTRIARLVDARREVAV